MDQGIDVTRLQQAADYRTVRKTVRGGGIACLIFGVLALLAGVAPPFDRVLTAVGLVLLTAGMWNSVVPTPVGIVAEAVAILAVGLYNVASVFGGAGAGSTFWAVLGAWQCVWGVQAFARYRRFANAFHEEPTDVELQQVEDLLKGIRKAKVRQSPEHIEFITHGVLQAQPWRARLLEQSAVCVMAGGQEVRVIPRAQLEMVATGKALIGKSVRVTVTLGGRPCKATVPAESFRRYEAWKAGVALPQAIAA
jgi:hypothetical protein